MLTRNAVHDAVIKAGICPGDTVIVHSSFKSLGPVEGGAETVISGFLDALGQDGTLVLPTFCQKDFVHSYETWHMDKPSDTGYLTEYFRTRPGSIRSDQATHSVAAAGAKAQWLTQTHGHTHKRFGCAGDTPFSADSPWEKMYQSKAKILMLGVGPVYTTFQHYAEYVFVEQCLQSIADPDARQAMEDRLTLLARPGAWPYVNSPWVCEQLQKQGKVRTSQCGNARILCYDAAEFVDFTLNALKTRDQRVLEHKMTQWIPAWNIWLDDLGKIHTK